MKMIESKKNVSVFLAFLCVAFCASCSETDVDLDIVVNSSTETLSFENAYVRALPSSVKNTSAYMTINNLSDESLVLTGAISNIAESIMIHQTSSDSGMMSMNHIMSASIPAHGELVLEPGGMHLMVMGLKAPLINNDRAELTLVFQNGFEFSVDLPVRSVLEE